MAAQDASEIDRIQTNLITYFRLFAGLPGIVFVEDDATWFVNTNAGEPNSHILRARWETLTVEQEIDRLLAHVGALTSSIDWLVFPGCLPSDLGKRLKQRGLEEGLAGTWMIADLAALPEAKPPPSGFSVRQVRDDGMLEVWKQVSSAGFGEDEQIYYDAYARHGYGPDAQSLHYIGYAGEQPVTSGTLLLGDGIPGLYNISTPPAARGRGYGQALTAHMLQQAIVRGSATVWTWASDDGKSTYEKLGFVQHDFGVREYAWRAS
jgi:GNAT superfamily N-acetyltransferase